MEKELEMEYEKLYAKVMNRIWGKEKPSTSLRQKFSNLRLEMRRVPLTDLHFFASNEFQPDHTYFFWESLCHKHIPFAYVKLLGGPKMSITDMEKLRRALLLVNYRNYPSQLLRKFMNHNFKISQQITLLDGIKRGISPEEHDKWELLINPQLSSDQIKQVVNGLLDTKLTTAQVRVYAKPVYSSEQMAEIHMGIQTLPRELWASYANANISSERMKLIRLGFEQGVSNSLLKQCSEPGFSDLQCIEILKGALDKRASDYVELYANPKFTWRQMQIIRMAISKGLTEAQIKALAKPEYYYTAMQKIAQDFINANDVKQSRNCDMEKQTNFERTKGNKKTSYFAPQIDSSVRLHHENTWNAWLQSKQVFLYEASFAASILADSAAVERVECEVLCRCPYTSCYIEAQEENGNKLTFFAVLEDNVLQLLPVEGDVVGQLHELRIDQHFDCGEMLAVIDNSEVKNYVMKMLQLYVCLCSAEMEDMQPTVEHAQLPARAHQQTERASNQSIPSWDADVYTVTMQRTAKKNRPHKRSSSDTDSNPRRPHKRRAHWHHYWVGSKADEISRRRIVKWVSETDVNSTEADLPVRIILVRKK